MVDAEAAEQAARAAEEAALAVDEMLTLGVPEEAEPVGDKEAPRGIDTREMPLTDEREVIEFEAEAPEGISDKDLVELDLGEVEIEEAENEELGDYRGEPIMPEPPPPPIKEADDFGPPAVAEHSGVEAARQNEVDFMGDDDEVESDLSAAFENIRTDAEISADSFQPVSEAEEGFGFAWEKDSRRDETRVKAEVPEFEFDFELTDAKRKEKSLDQEVEGAGENPFKGSSAPLEEAQEGPKEPEEALGGEVEEALGTLDVVERPSDSAEEDPSVEKPAVEKAKLGEVGSVEGEPPAESVEPALKGGEPTPDGLESAPDDPPLADVGAFDDGPTVVDITPELESAGGKAGATPRGVGGGQGGAEGDGADASLKQGLEASVEEEGSKESVEAKEAEDVVNDLVSGAQGESLEEGGGADGEEEDEEGEGESVEEGSKGGEESGDSEEGDEAENGEKKKKKKKGFFKRIFGK